MILMLFMFLQFLIYYYFKYILLLPYLFFDMKSENKEDLYTKIYTIVRNIPPGKVSTYGAIAERIGIRSSARMVGWALNKAAGNTEIPCHRVVNRNGELSGKMHFATPTLMKELLEAEGVDFIDEAVNMKKHFWEPIPENDKH